MAKKTKKLPKTPHPRGKNLRSQLWFDNPENPKVHYQTTAREILTAMGELPVHAFVAGVGTAPSACRPPSRWSVWRRAVVSSRLAYIAPAS